MRQHRLLLASLTLTLLVFAGLDGGAAAFRTAGGLDLPARLTDKELWTLVEELSEPDGAFQSDNLLSNEMVFARIVPALVAHSKPGGVYLGVGPEQNFTYMAAIRPRIAFITDVRRGNLHMQLMYKALFELSADRAEFVSRLFTKPRPAVLTAASTSTELMNAYWDIATSSEAVYTTNLEAIHRHLTKTRSLPLSTADLDGIARVYRTFYWYGPSMNYSASTGLYATSGAGTTYWHLMTQTDASGQGLSYLASEEKFQFLKDLESRNLVVPLVGNFGGPKAIRAVGAYLKARSATVTAFYVSNVESYLTRGGLWQAFCANVATLPLDDASVFIRPSGLGRGTFQIFTTTASGTRILTSPPAATGAAAPGAGSGLVPIAAEVKACAGASAAAR